MFECGPNPLTSGRSLLCDMKANQTKLLFLTLIRRRVKCPRFSVIISVNEISLLRQLEFAPSRLHFDRPVAESDRRLASLREMLPSVVLIISDELVLCLVHSD